MADRFPLIVDSNDGNQIKEIPAGDNLDLRDVSIINVKDVDTQGTLNAAILKVDDVQVRPDNYLKKTGDLEFYGGNQFKFLRVGGDGKSIDFIGLEEAGLLNGEFTGPIYPDVDGTLQVGQEDRKWAEVNALVINADSVNADLLDSQARLIYDYQTGFLYTYEDGQRKKLVSENKAIVYSIIF